MTMGELVEEFWREVGDGRPQDGITGVNGRERVSPADLVFAEDAAAAAEALNSNAGAVVAKAGLAASYAANPDIAVDYRGRTPAVVVCARGEIA